MDGEIPLIVNSTEKAQKDGQFNLEIGYMYQFVYEETIQIYWTKKMNFFEDTEKLNKLEEPRVIILSTLGSFFDHF